MTKAETAKLLGLMAAMYPKFEITELKVELWADLIGDIPYSLAQAALKKVMMTSEFIPTVAEIRKAAAESISTKEDELTAGEAWGEVRKAIAACGWPEPGKAYDMMSPITQQVVKQIGWHEICMCEEPGVVRGQFMKIFNTTQERDKQNRLLPEGFKNQIKALADVYIKKLT